jgi:hypothetical protein
MTEEIISEYTVKETDEEIKPIEKKTTKEYNKEYYDKNKEVLLRKALTKEKCPHCDRTIAHQELFKHQKTKYCQKRRELNNTFKRT